MTRIRRGFRRLGLVGLVPLGAVGLLCLALAALGSINMPQRDTSVVWGADGKKYEIEGIYLSRALETKLFERYGRPIKVRNQRYPRQQALAAVRYYTELGIYLLALGLAWFAICRVLGWVVSGFTREDQP